MIIELSIRSDEFNYKGKVELVNPTGEAVTYTLDSLNEKLRNALIDHALKGESRERVRKFKMAMVA